MDLPELDVPDLFGSGKKKKEVEKRREKMNLELICSKNFHKVQ